MANQVFEDHCVSFFPALGGKGYFPISSGNRKKQILIILSDSYFFSVVPAASSEAGERYIFLLASPYRPGLDLVGFPCLHCETVFRTGK